MGELNTADNVVHIKFPSAGWKLGKIENVYWKQCNCSFERYHNKWLKKLEPPVGKKRKCLISCLFLKIR